MEGEEWRQVGFYFSRICVRNCQLSILLIGIESFLLKKKWVELTEKHSVMFNLALRVWTCSSVKGAPGRDSVYRDSGLIATA